MHDISRLTRRLALLVPLGLLAAGIASAQSYQIQVRFTVRLRASYDIDSPVVGKALAGDVLQVVERYNRWLKIERDGMQPPGWPIGSITHGWISSKHRPPQPQPISSSGQTSTIAVSWIASATATASGSKATGAYQRNECPAQPQPGLSPAPTSGHPITIDGSFLFVDIITEALDALRDRAPHWYEYVTSNLNLIFERGSSRPSGHYRAAGSCGLGPYRQEPLFGT